MCTCPNGSSAILTRSLPRQPPTAYCKTEVVTNVVTNVVTDMVIDVVTSVVTNVETNMVTNMVTNVAVAVVTNVRRHIQRMCNSNAAAQLALGLLHTKSIQATRTHCNPGQSCSWHTK